MAYRYEARSSAWILLFPTSVIISPALSLLWQHRKHLPVEMPQPRLSLHTLHGMKSLGVLLGRAPCTDVLEQSCPTYKVTSENEELNS